MLKRILALAIVAMLLVAIVIIPASAAETRGETCTSCNGTVVATSRTVWNSWGTYKTVTCIHGTGGYDDYQKRTGVNTYKKCNGCGKTWKKTVTEYRTLCNGVVVG